ncbi:DsbA family protein [Microbacterium sp. NPDC055910]|uniref:DsbA family protein n=1 Tax=Microbacterium sp. NPDC055910 TaxID=3345659 RepID=UPI0035D87557
MAQARKVNPFAIWISIGVVVALILVTVLVVWMNNTANAPGPRPESSGINSETGAIQVGTGSDELDVWFDFYCSHCQNFEKTYGPTVDDLLDEGTITANLFPVALANLNAASGTDFSERSANAMYCVAEAAPDASYPFMQAVFGAGPTGGGLTDEQLISEAEKAGATGIDTCVEEREYVDFVRKQTNSIPEGPGGGAGTPTIVLNGDFVTLTGDPAADLLAPLR